MKKTKVTREQQVLLTRTALIRAARRLFTQKGYHATGTHEIVATAEVTRGALAHYFPKKQDLFVAVFQEVQLDLMARAAANANSHRSGKDQWAAFRNGLAGFLEAATEPEVQRVLLLDGPVVLGWTNWRKLQARHALGRIKETVKAAMKAGLIRTTPIESFAHLLLAAIHEAALLVANAKKPVEARAEAYEALDVLLSNLA